MAFSDLQPNQMVSEADAATGGFPLQSGQSHGSSNQCMSKDAANIKYVLDQAPLGSYAGNQLIPKSVWVSGVINYAYLVSFNGFINPRDSCNEVSPDFQYLYSSSSTIVEGMQFFTNSNLTTPFNGGGWYFQSGDLVSKSLKIHTSGTLVEIFDCSLTYGGSLTLNIPGYGNNVAPQPPGSGVISGYTLNSGIQINNASGSETVMFTEVSLSNPYPILAEQGAARLMQFASTTSVSFLTTPAHGDIISPGSFATWLAFGKNSGSGLVVLSLETLTNSGTRQQVFWTFSI